MNKKTVYIILLFLLTFFSINNLEAEASREKQDLYVAQEALRDGFYDVAIEKSKAFIEKHPGSEEINFAYLLLGRSYYQKKDFHLAVVELEKVIASTNPQYKDEACYWLGKIYIEGKEFGIAGSFFKKIVDEFSNSDFLPHAHYYLAVSDNLSGNYQEARGRCELIITEYQKSSVVDLAYIELSKSLYGLSKFDESDEVLFSYLKKFPNSSLMDKAYFQLGENNFRKANLKKAIEFYKKVQEIKPEAETAKVALKKEGLVYYELKDYIKAIETFDRLAAENPKSPFIEEVTFVKAQAFRGLGENESALRVFKEVIGFDSSKADYGLADDSYLYIGDTYYQMGRYEDSISVYSNFIEKFPQSPLKEEAFYNLGWVYLRLKRYEEAEAEFQKITHKLTTKDEVLKIIALCRLGDTYLDKGEYERATAAYDEVLENYPNSFYSDYAQYQLAVVFEKNGRLDEALISLETLMINFPKSKLMDQTYYLSALLHLKKGQYNKALECYRDITLYFPGSQYRELSMLGEGHCLYNLSEFDKALETFRKFDKKFSDSQHKERVKFEIAQTLFASGKEKEAKEKFIQLTKESRDLEIRDEARMWLAQYDFERENYTEAQKQFRVLCEDSDNNYFKSISYYWLAKIAHLEGDRENSLKLFGLASNLSQGEELKLKIEFERADVFLELAELERALSIYDNIINKYPHSNFAILSYKQKADIELSQERFILARQNYARALSEVKSDFNAQVQYQIAKTYLAEDKLTEALGEFFTLVYLYPESIFWKQKAQLEAADIYKRQGKLSEAQKIYVELSEAETEIAQLAKNRLDSF